MLSAVFCGAALLFLSASVNGADSPPKQCTATRLVSPGPVYRAGVPIQEKDPTICKVQPGTVFVNATTQFGKRDEVPAEIRRLHVSGTIKSTDGCTPISGAIVDVWQSSADGAYSPVWFGVESPKQDCRGVIRATDSGKYKFETTFPGSYGLSAGVGYGGLDFPPWGPRHIHVIVWAPGYEPISTQLYFDGDLSSDFREKLVSEVGHGDPTLLLKPVESRKEPGLWEGTFDFVLTPNDDIPKTREEAILTLCSTEKMSLLAISPTLCLPNLSKFVALIYTALPYVLPVYLVYAIFLRKSSSKSKSD